MKAAEAAGEPSLTASVPNASPLPPPQKHAAKSPLWLNQFKRRTNDGRLVCAGYMSPALRCLEGPENEHGDDLLSHTPSK